MIYKDISHVNWGTLESPDTPLDVLGIEGSFLVPQLLAFVASQVPLVYSAEGKISFKDTLLQTIEKAKASGIEFQSGRKATVAEVRGILCYLSHAPRGEVLGKGNKQIAPTFIRYATGVPLVLSAFREYKDIPYSMWDWAEPLSPYHIYLVDKDILELVPYIHNMEAKTWSKDELLHFRTEGSTVKSGPNLGSTKHFNQVTAITGITDPEFKSYPKLLKLMYCQTWVYQPSVRSKYALTDILNIDGVAEDITGGIVGLFDTTTTKEVDIWL